MFKLRYFQSAALALAFSPTLWADTVTLKSGEKVEGKISAESDTEITMQVQVTPTISDVRTIAKTDVASVDKQKPDELAYEALKAVQPGPNSLPALTYTADLQVLQNFLTQFPQSPHVAEVTQRLATLTEENRRSQAGEVKIAGQWLKKEEVERERYQISGQLLLAQMQDQARRNDLVGALNTLDQIEKQYPGARAMPEAIELGRQLLPALQGNAERTLQNLKARNVERDRGVKNASDKERPELKAAIDREDKQNAATVDAASKAGLKWPPFLSTSEKALTSIVGKISTEQTRLQGLPVAKMRDSLKASDQGAKLLESGDNAGAQESFKEATTLWAVNEAAIRLGKDATAKLAMHATPAAAAPEATPAATPAHAATPIAHATPLAPPVPMATPEPAEEEKSGHGLFYTVVVLALLGGGYLVMHYRRKKRLEQEGADEDFHG